MIKVSYHLINLIKSNLIIIFPSSLVLQILQTNKIDSKISLSDLFKFALKNISHNLHSIRTASTTIIQKLTSGLIGQDLELLNRRNEQSERNYRHLTDEDEEGRIESWHILSKFNVSLLEAHEQLKTYIEDFSLKITELESATPIPPTVAIPYLLLWECILNICAQSTSELRSIYATWITRNQYELVSWLILIFFIYFNNTLNNSTIQILMPTLFKLMPYEILRNPDSGFVYGQSLFSNLEWKSMKGELRFNYCFFHGVLPFGLGFCFTLMCSSSSSSNH